MNLKYLFYKYLTRKKTMLYSELLELLEDGTITIDDRIPEYRWREGVLYHIKNYFRERFKQLSEHAFIFNENHKHQYSTEYMTNHPITGDSISYLLTEDLVIKPFYHKEREYDIYLPYEKYPKTKTVNDFYSFDIDIPSGELVYTGYELWKKLNFSEEWRELYRSNIDFYESERGTITRMKHFLDSRKLFISQKGCTGAIFKKDGKYTFTDYHETYYIFDEDFEEGDSLPFNDKQLEIINNCGEFIEDIDMNSDKALLILDSSDLPKDAKYSDYKTLDVEPGRYRIDSNIYFCDEDDDKRFLTIEKID